MPDAGEWKIVPQDIEILRELGRRKLAIANDPVNVERRRLWQAHGALNGARPMVLTEPWVAFEMLPDAQVSCQEEWARTLEKHLRFEIFQFEKVKDDHVVEPYIDCNWFVTVSDYGVTSIQHYAHQVNNANIASRSWDPPLQDLDRDFDKLRPRTYSVDRERTHAWKAHLQHVFEGILRVRIRGGFWWSTGMTNVLIDLVGLENMMTLMYTNPEGIHRIMAFLRDDYLAYSAWLEREGLFSLNNGNDYIGSGSMGYCGNVLPGKEEDGAPVRRKDLWVLSESQETIGVSPAMFEEFVFQYQQPIVESFGSCYYGCCEPLHQKWPVVKKFPNLGRLSISPWCDEEFMAQELGRKYVYSRKPNPAMISMSDFDESVIRADLRHTLTVAKGCNIEIIMKDVHTLSGDPQRIMRWVELAREAVDASA
ncbi:MAG: hypothetical protein HZB26_09045 [Candidatus Hydrogenedentes bacterium]|nr:hypothetical protein [Candidatus Hydrogenedentota bacterium]